MKKFRPLIILLCLLLALQGFSTVAYADETEASTEETAATQETVQLPLEDTFSVDDASVLYGCHTPDARYPIFGSEDRLHFSASGILYEVTSRTLVYTWNPDVTMYPSSLVKIMTALIALENGDLSESVTASRAALDTVPLDAVRADLYGGEVVTLEQLLNLMLVGSCNDAAAVIAEHIGGTQENFVALMNQRARELGCTGTNFVNPTGLHDDLQVTTARDVVKILEKALQYPEFVEMFGTPSYTLPATNMSGERTFQTTNYMISNEEIIHYKDDRVLGGRTGVTDAGDRCLAVTAKDGDAIYIAVTLGTSPDYGEDGSRPGSHGSFWDTDILLDLASDRNTLVQVLTQEQIVAQVSVENGSNDVVVGPMEAVSCVLPYGFSKDLLTTRIEYVDHTVSAPVNAGGKMAVYQAWYGSICIAQVNLYALNSASLVQQTVVQQTPVTDDQGFDAGSLYTAFMVLGVIFAVILVLGGGLFLVRNFNIFMRKNRSRKRRQDRRRSK